MTLFRPPYGDYNNQVVEMADSMGYYPIQWDVETLEMVVKEIQKKEEYRNNKELPARSSLLFAKLTKNKTETKTKN